MRKRLTQVELESYLDEDLTPEEMAEVENTLRDDPKLLDVLAQLNTRRDAGVHSLGEIWRRNRISCPTREQLGSYLLGTLSDQQADYISLHVQKIGCRICGSNLEDLRRQDGESSDTAAGRRHRYFQSSAGYLHQK